MCKFDIAANWKAVRHLVSDDGENEKRMMELTAFSPVHIQRRCSLSPIVFTI